ncbi:hypothetical protein QBC43DRAFT_315721 [Cladorrhinum sp. PSN259]|nr:hypothetical protein QBC43DRAFT_315721 [Cladorrhinum sp. PSN259]
MEKQTIENMWAEAETLFKQLTGQSLGSSPGDLRKRIEARSSDKDNAEAKDTGLKILACVKLLGGVVAQAASTVFGPAEMCFSAISILLDVPKKIHEFNEIIDSVFISIAPVLSQYKIYARIEQFDRMDDDLIIATHSVLISLVTICARVINLEKTKKWAKLKKFTNAVTCGNEDLQGELEKFDALVRNQQLVQGSVVLEKVLESKGDLANLLTLASESKLQLNDVRAGVMSLVEAEGSRKSDEMRKERLEKIKARLGFDKGATDNSKAVCADMWKKTLSVTGKWFTRSPDFNDWADSEKKGTGPMLLLTGVPSSGKSFSTSAIVRHLTLAFSMSKQTRRSLIGYHFFAARSQKTDDESKPAHTALKWIAIQLAEQDDAYSKHLADACLARDKDEELFDKATLKDLWNILKLGSPMPRTTHYILFDAVNSLNAETLKELQELFSTLDRPDPDRCSSVRILASGRNDVFDEDFVELLSCPVVKLEGDHFKEELRGYIEFKLRAPDMLPDESLAEQRQMIAARLLERSVINFRFIQNALDGIKEVIASSGSEKELDDILDRLDRDDVVIAKETLSKLETELSPKELALVNELLIWVVGSFQLHTIPRLEAALFLRNMDLPLRGLRNFVETRLKKLFEFVFEDEVQMRTGMSEVVMKQRDVSRSSGPQTISLELKITNADVATVQRFLWDLTRFSTLENFGFANNGPNSQSISLKQPIGVNNIDAHLAIVKCAVKFLQGPQDSRSERAGPYLVDWLPDHLDVLRYATGLDSVGEADMREISQCVLELFEDPRLFRTHWHFFKGFPSFITLDIINSYWNWLHDEAASRGFNRKQREWIRTTLKPRQKYRLVFSLVKTVADIWLRSSEGLPHEAFTWVRKYLFLLDKRKSAYALLPRDDIITQITTAEKWCKLKLGVSRDSLWYERLGETFSWAERYSQAASCYRKAVQYGKPSWDLYKKLADVLRLDYLLLGACATLQQATETYHDSDKVTAIDKSLVLRDIAGVYLLLGQPTKGEEYYRRTLELHQFDSEAWCALICVQIALGKEDEVKATILSTLKKKQSIDGGYDEELSLLGSAIVLYCEGENEPWWYKLFWRMLSLAATSDSCAILLKDMSVGIDRAKADSHHSSHCMLLVCKGSVHFFRGGCGRDPEQTSLALKCWEDARGIARRTIPTEGWELGNIYSKAFWFLGLYYFDLAMENRRSVSSEKSEADVNGSPRAAANPVGKLQSLVREHEQVVGGLSSAKSYLASFHALQDDFESAKAVFAADMAKASNTLSDGYNDNDRPALAQLVTIFMNTGEFENAYVALMACSCYPEHLFKYALKEVLTELFNFGQDSELEEGSVATQIILFSESNCSPQNDTALNIRILLSKANELKAERLAAMEATRQREKQITARNEVVVEVTGISDIPDRNNSLPDRDPTASEKVEATGDQKPEITVTVGPALPDNESNNNDVTPVANQPAVSPQTSDLRIITILENLQSSLSDTYMYNQVNCMGCRLETWGLGSEMFACKYCYNTFLCGTCVNQLKAESTWSPSFVCRSNHEWLRFPKMTPKHWVESFMGVVRVPKGTDDDGNFIDGDEAVTVPTWLTEVMKPWGIERSDWDMDSGRTAPSTAPTSPPLSPLSGPRSPDYPPPYQYNSDQGSGSDEDELSDRTAESGDDEDDDEDDEDDDGQVSELDALEEIQIEELVFHLPENVAPPPQTSDAIPSEPTAPAVGVVAAGP